MALHGGTPLQAMARAWLAAFNARDLEGLLRLYADHAVHTSPKLRARDPATGGKVRGKAALRGWFADAFERLPGLHYEPLHLTAQGHRVFLEYRRTVPGEAPYVVAEVLVTGNDGLIAESFVFHG
ncbi:MAG: nuclear transport factor 2 family protein [Deltaproteobacteria bacterium]|nr:nuclear transport factor 2 family protein [Deltaproteobacteria bacterium]